MMRTCGSMVVQSDINRLETEVGKVRSWETSRGWMQLHSKEGCGGFRITVCNRQEA